MDLLFVVVDGLLDDFVESTHNLPVFGEFEHAGEFFWHFFDLKVDASGVGIGDEVELVDAVSLFFFEPSYFFLDVRE